MAQATVGSAIAPAEEDIVSSSSAVTWSAIFAGGVTAAAISIVLIMLGSGIGLLSVSPWSNEGVSATAIGFGAVAWLIVVQWLSSGLGGYLAGRLRTKWTGVHTYEVFFRDTAHGFLAWAIATLATAIFLTSTIAAVIGAGTQAASTVVGGAAQGATMGAAAAAGDAGGADPTAYFTDLLFRTETSPAAPAGGAAGGEAGGARGEAGRILLQSAADGEIDDADRGYLATLVARETGLSQEEATARVNQVMERAEAARQEAVEAVDAARKAAATLSIAMVLALLIGAFIASVTAAIGGRQRDDFETSPPPV